MKPSRAARHRLTAATALRSDHTSGRELTCYRGAKAHTLCDFYESAAFDTIHRQWLKHIPEIPGSALDVGSGSGRDASALAQRGWHVVGVDCSPDMLREAKSRHGQAEIRWVEDSLPDLEIIVAERERFLLILCSAVWMHLTPQERAVSMKTIRGLLHQNGIAVITIRHPPDPTRHMFDVDIAETADLANRNGLVVVQTTHASDPVETWQRRDISWSTIVLRQANSLKKTSPTLGT